MADKFGFKNQAFNKYYYEIEDKTDPQYMKDNFEVSGFMNNIDLSYDVNTVSRFRNGLVGAIRDHKTFPKFVVIVPDNDIIKYIKGHHATSSAAMERILKWLMSQMDRLIATQREYLPLKARSYPTMIWIAPPSHRNFCNNELRKNFTRALEKCASYHNKTFALHLKKSWEENDSALFNADDNRLTVAGYKSYWSGVDKALKFANTLLLKKEERKTEQ